MIAAGEGAPRVTGPVPGPRTRRRGQLLVAAAEPPRTMILVGTYADLRRLSEGVTLR